MGSTHSTTALAESAAEVTALIPRHAWSLMDEDQRDALMREVVLPRYMAVTADGVKLGPSWWAGAVGASPAAIKNRVQRLRQSQRSSNGRGSRHTSASRTLSALRDPQRRQHAFSELDDNQLDDIRDAAATVKIHRRRARQHEMEAEPTVNELLGGDTLENLEEDLSKNFSDLIIINVGDSVHKLNQRVNRVGLLLRSLPTERALEKLVEAERELAEVRAAAQELLNEGKG
jgi:hypothetical protein